jgi:hypothetical protein
MIRMHRAPDLAAATPENAWKILDSVNAKIDSADIKAGSILAACGVTATVVLSLIGHHRGWGVTASVAAMLAVALAFGAAGFACLALRPRRRRTESPSSLLYFDHIARRKGETPGQYGEALTDLLHRPDAIVTSVAGQIWATARVAARKYYWIDRAMVSLFGSLLALAVTGVMLALHHYHP